MKKSSREKAFIRIVKSCVDGCEPDPADLELAKRSPKGGRPVGYSDTRPFYMRVNYAWAFIYARKVLGMRFEDAIERTERIMKGMHIEKNLLYKYCSYLRSGATPTDNSLRTFLEFSRSTLEQVEHPSEDLIKLYYSRLKSGHALLPKICLKSASLERNHNK